MGRLAVGATLVTVAGSRGGVAHADTALDVRILQTASSLEVVAVAAYGPGWDGVGALAAFARESRRQHGAHLRAFQARTSELDRAARVQDAPHPRFQTLLRAADLGSPGALVAFAATIEQATIDTYLSNLGLLGDGPTKALLGSIMALAAQRLAALRTMGLLLGAGAAPGFEAPLPLSALVRLPKAVVTAAVPAALHDAGPADLVADPASGVPG